MVWRLKMSKNKAQQQSLPSEPIRLKDRIRVSSKTGEAYITESDLLASEEFRLSMERLRTFRDNELIPSRKSES